MVTGTPPRGVKKKRKRSSRKGKNAYPGSKKSTRDSGGCSRRKLVRLGKKVGEKSKGFEKGRMRNPRRLLKGYREPKVRRQKTGIGVKYL